MNKPRHDVPEKDTWNLEALYAGPKEWQHEFETINNTEKNPRWPDLVAYKGCLGESPEILKKAVESYLKLDRAITKLYVFARMRHDEDISNDANKQNYSKISSLLHDFHHATSWFEPELLSLPDNTIKQYISSPLLSEYKFHIEKMLRVKPHILTADQEALMAISGKALQTPYKAFSAINDADFSFGIIKDSKGQEKELTHASYGLYLRDQDRTLRKNAFLSMHNTYGNYENTLCELINGQVQGHLFQARARKYASCLEAALFPNNIDPHVYHSLIHAVRSNIDAMYDYVKLRKKLPGIDQLHLYDMYMPMSADVNIQLPYEDAENIVIESVAPLGVEYQNTLKQGFKINRWVDRYENKHKRSGAYSSGCYDSMPYILMNYKELLRDVFTLAHEAGHSMHSYLSHKNQPYHYGDYPIFLAEVASTFNEELLIRLLLQRATTKAEKVYLLTQKIEDIRTTLFRQTMFAEFELLLHDMAEKNIPLTPALLREEFRKLNEFYFGPDVVIDKEAEIEWARIPHFYYNFYVYQYATGISAALALADRVLQGGDRERNDYLNFLKGGSRQYPIEMLKAAGVDMCSSQPIEASINRFRTLVKELAALM